MKERIKIIPGILKCLLLFYFYEVRFVSCGHPHVPPPPPPCSSNPCQNSGSCSNTGSAFLCACTDAYEGTQCEVDRCDHKHFANTLPDIVFIVDSSMNIGTGYFDKSMEYIDKFVSFFDIGPSYFQFSVITYSFNGTVEFDLDDYLTTSALKTAISNIVYSTGPSYTGAGLRAARMDVFGSSSSGRRSAPGHAIVLSDGLSSNLSETLEEATLLKKSGIDIAVVGIGPQILHEELLDIASSVWKVYTSTNTDLMHHIYKTYASLCPDCARNYADIEILLEVSKDFTRAEFNNLVSYLKFLLEITNIGPSQVRIGLTHIWSEVKQIFSLDSHTDVNTLIADAISTASQKSGSTNISKAFDHVIQNGFSSDSRRIVLLLSSGRYTDTDMSDAQTKVEKLKLDGIYIVTVGVCLKSNLTNLLDIASDPSLCFLIGDDVHIDKRSLQALLSTFEYDFCDGYVDLDI